MTGMLVLVIGVEVFLILITTLLLTQPKSLWVGSSPRWEKALLWTGMLFLCLTFCWSVVLGINVSFHRMILSV